MHGDKEGWIHVACSDPCISDYTRLHGGGSTCMPQHTYEGWRATVRVSALDHVGTKAWTQTYRQLSSHQPILFHSMFCLLVLEVTGFVVARVLDFFCSVLCLKQGLCSQTRLALNLQSLSCHCWILSCLPFVYFILYIYLRQDLTIQY